MGNKTFNKIVSESSEALNKINSEQLNSLIEEKKDMVILDVSDKEVVEKRGSVPGALNVSLGTLYFKADAEVPDEYKDSRIQNREKKL